MIIELCTNCGEYCDGRGYCQECGVYTLIDDDEEDIWDWPDDYGEQEINDNAK